MTETQPLPRRAVVERLRAVGCADPEDAADLLIAAADDDVELEDLLSRREAGMPIEQILGWTEFDGRRVLVEPGVFVPRRSTELLVRAAAALVRHGAVVVDLCCGSGAVGAVLARSVSGLTVHAVDVDPVAVACAEHNLDALGGRAHLGDLYAALPGELRGRVDLITAKPPYQPSRELASMPDTTWRYEPRRALDGGPDGLDVQQRVIAEAAEWLSPGGHLVVETSRRLLDRTLRLVADAGLLAHPPSVQDEAVAVVVAALPEGIAAGT